MMEFFPHFIRETNVLKFVTQTEILETNSLNQFNPQITSHTRCLTVHCVLFIKKQM